jgi:hypothetical protein
MHSDRCSNTLGQEFYTTRSRNKTEYLYIETQRIWSVKYMIKPVIIGVHGRVTKGFKKFGSHTRKTFNRSTTKDSYTRNITHSIESTAV